MKLRTAKWNTACRGTVSMEAVLKYPADSVSALIKYLACRKVSHIECCRTAKYNKFMCIIINCRKDILVA